MENFVTIARSLLLSDLAHDGIVVNYTMTGGNDTLYLAKFVSEGNVYGFSEDGDTIDAAMALFESAFQDNVHVIQDEPKEIKKYIKGSINGFILNTVKSNMRDEDIKELISISLDIMKRGAKGGILMSGDKRETLSFLESIGRDRCGVMKLGMFNEDLPDVYIIEKH